MDKLLDKDVSIYTVDGALTGTAPSNIRTLDYNGSSMSFKGSQQRTFFNSSGILQQEALSTSVSGLANIIITTPDRNANNVSTRLSLQAFPESNTQVFAGLDALTLAVSYTHLDVYKRQLLKLRELL